MDASTLMQLLISLALGVSLSASCGFRVFVPCLITSVAAMAGWVHLGDGFAWLGTWPAVICLGIATVCEVAAYYIPAVDNFLDSLSVPASGIAGTILTASLITGDVSPMVQWALAIIAGGGTAIAVNSATAGARAASTATTAGLGNGGIATAELGASTGLSILAIALPLVAVVVTALILVGCIALIRHFVRKRRAKAAQAAQNSAE